MIRRLLPLLAVALIASCAPSTKDASGVVTDTAANLADITSADLTLRLTNTTRDGDEGGFSIDGPFSFESKGDLPIADVEYTAFDGSDEQTARFVSTGEDAYLVQDDKVRKLTPALVEEMGIADLVRRDDTPIGKIDIGDWIDGEPEISGGGLVGGVDTNKVTATLDVPPVMDGIIALARGAGSAAADDLDEIEGAEAERVREAVKNATLEVWSGKDDRLLRKLEAEIVFEVGNERVREAFGNLAGATVRLEAELGDVNEPVEVDAPER